MIFDLLINIFDLLINLYQYFNQKEIKNDQLESKLYRIHIKITIVDEIQLGPKFGYQTLFASPSHLLQFQDKINFEV